MSKPVTLATNDIHAAQILVQEHLARAWSAPQYTREEEEALKTRIKALLEQHNAVLVAHYYTDPLIQALAEETGGCVSDSLEMARFGKNHPATTLIVAGVKFMGETAKILTPEKRVLMPTLEATCSLDLARRGPCWNCSPTRRAELHWRGRWRPDSWQPRWRR